MQLFLSTSLASDFLVRALLAALWLAPSPAKTRRWSDFLMSPRLLLVSGKGLYTKEEGMQLPMVAIQTAKCKSLLKIATFSISAWAGEDWTFVALWFCVVVKSSGVLGECYLA